MKKPSIKRSPRNRNARVTLHGVIKKDRNEAVRQNAVRESATTNLSARESADQQTCREDDEAIKEKWDVPEIKRRVNSYSPAAKNR